MKKVVTFKVVIFLLVLIFNSNAAEVLAKEKEINFKIDSYIEYKNNHLKSALSSWKKDTPLQKHINDISLYAKEYDIDPIFIIAVAIQETGAGTAKDSSYDQRNFFGIIGKKGYQKFKKEEESIKRFAELIRNSEYYIRDGLNSVDEIGPIYCTSDRNWEKNVNFMIHKMKKEINKNKCKTY